MNHDHESKPTHAQEIEKPGVEYNENEKTDAAHRAEAIMAESAEHNMTVLEAVKAYPMASFWAFVFSCTIVRHLCLDLSFMQQLTIADHGILRCLPHW
jgi:SP family general alpha glucoside:H+ symporter-like MFS transporter